MAADNPKRKTCYACSRTATTREHAPPISFFPSELRKNLITVPSCRLHNNDNSADVEYVRNVLVLGANLGPESAGAFDAAMRSVKRRPSVVKRRFPQIRPIATDGQDSGLVEIDLPRFKRIMTAIAQALHYQDLGIKQRRWGIFSPTLHSEESLVSGNADNWEPLKRVVAVTRYRYLPTSQPDVFAYGRAEMKPSSYLYQMIFYNAVIVGAWPL